MSRPHRLPAIRAKALRWLGVFAFVGGMGSGSAATEGNPHNDQRVSGLRLSSALDLDRVSASDDERELLRLRGRVINNLMAADDVMGSVALLEQTQAQLLRRLSGTVSPAAPATPASAPDAMTGESAVGSAAFSDLFLPLGGALLALTAALGAYRRRPTTASADAATIVQPHVAAAQDSLPVLDTRPAAEAGTTVPAEIEDRAVLELAEMMLGFGRVKGAAVVLHEYISKNPDEALRPWIKLLDVYRQAGMRHRFEEVARRLHQRFNVQRLDWEEANPALSGNSVESFPHIVESLVAHWGSAQGVAYLKHLLLDNRGGERTGFSYDVVDELMLLQGVLEERLRADSASATAPESVSESSDPESVSEPDPTTVDSQPQLTT